MHPAQGSNVNPIPTERFSRVLAFASDEADGLGHGFVTCQHLLYALTRESKGLANSVLDSLEITPDAVHAFLAESDASHDRTTEGRIDLADEARDALDRSVSIAREWGHRVLDTEHILYGLVSGTTSADDLFSSFQVSPNEILARLYAVQQSAPESAVREEATHAYKLTLESAWALSLAVDAARQHNAANVSSLHLLVALISLESPAQLVLIRDLGLNADAMIQHLHGGAQGSPVTHRRLPLSDDVQRILGHAIGEAWNRGHLAVTPMHLALGLARADRHAALNVLADLGISQADLLDVLEAAMPPSVLR